MMDRGKDAETAGEHQSGPFLGMFEGLVIRGVIEDSGHPVLEIHGDDKMAAVECTEKAVDGLTEAAAEIQTAIDRREANNA